MSHMLTINGRKFPVDAEGASEGAAIPVGETVRTFNGTARSGVWAQVRNWSFTSTFLTPELEAYLRYMVALDTEVSVSGYLMSEVPILCIVRVTTSDFTSAAGNTYGLARIVKIYIEESAPTPITVPPDPTGLSPVVLTVTPSVLNLDASSVVLTVTPATLNLTTA